MPVPLTFEIGVSAANFRSEMARLRAEAERLRQKLDLSNPFARAQLTATTSRLAELQKAPLLEAEARAARRRAAQEAAAQRMQEAAARRAEREQELAYRRSLRGQFESGWRGFGLQYIGATAFISLFNRLTRAVREFVTNSIQARIEGERMRAALRSVSGSAAEAAGAYTYLVREAKRVGFDARAMADHFARFTVAARTAGYTAEETRRVFTAVTEAGAAMGLSGERTADAMLALEQMLSKGKVQAEELRRQLGNALPAAINIMAAGLRMSLPQLYQALDRGALDSATAVRAFAEELRRQFKLTDDMNRLIRETNRLKTAWWELRQEVGKALEKPAVQVLEWLKGWMEVSQELRRQPPSTYAYGAWAAPGYNPAAQPQLRPGGLSQEEYAALEALTIYQARKRREAERQELDKLRAGSAPTAQDRLRVLEEEANKERNLNELLQRRIELEELLAGPIYGEARARALDLLRLTRAQLDVAAASDDAAKLRAQAGVLRVQQETWIQKRLAALRALEELQGRLDTRVTRPLRAAAEGELATAEYHLRDLAIQRRAIEEELGILAAREKRQSPKSAQPRGLMAEVTQFQHLSAYAGPLAQTGLDLQRRIADNTRRLVAQNDELLRRLRPGRPTVQFAAL